MKVADFILDSVLINESPALAKTGYVMSPDGTTGGNWDIKKMEVELTTAESLKIVGFVTDLLKTRILQQAKMDGVEV
jgi:hypothetical protein